jgi:hypothetical protein
MRSVCYKERGEGHEWSIAQMEVCIDRTRATTSPSNEIQRCLLHWPSISMYWFVVRATSDAVTLGKESVRRLHPP